MNALAYLFRSGVVRSGSRAVMLTTPHVLIIER